MYPLSGFREGVTDRAQCVCVCVRRCPFNPAHKGGEAGQFCWDQEEGRSQEEVSCPGSFQQPGLLPARSKGSSESPSTASRSCSSFCAEKDRESEWVGLGRGRSTCPRGPEGTSVPEEGTGIELGSGEVARVVHPLLGTVASHFPFGAHEFHLEISGQVR